MRIAVLAHVRHPVAPPFMGGMEAHAYHLARGLQARGHDVTLFASGDSDAGVPLHPVLPEHYDRAFPWKDHHGTDALNAHLDKAFADILPALREGGFDVIHNNSLHRYPPRMARRDRVPMVSSMHVPPFPALHRATTDSLGPWSRVTFCSHSHMAGWWPGKSREGAHVVPNGIDLSLWPFVYQGGAGAIWAGRIMPNKGAHLAAQAARIAGMPLTIFGTIEDGAYFDAEVAPLLGDDIRYGGHLSPADLAREYGKAAVLLFTPLWDEPFGLAAVEAMACGLPVAATDRGATAEVIGEGGCTVPPDPHALALALKEAAVMQRHVPRRRAKNAYSIDTMIRRYEALYAMVMAGASRSLAPPDYPPVMLPPREEPAGI
ncbi:glycosyltransferase [Allosediminivita pacifica]|uniref:Glycosyltransferase involved in cell wall biosynthesis n=1 Tax=Allosediminivita pacifica TaxID=1267769 RepID=A0A2T6B9L9_9RHOB|nr:glycosyltransferase [Allosediminivita pacifica]PTX52722.1 glycosyltransferase involved in cell wall biosynthesis [Allosediminivita pacifica]GGA96359.1 glycosyl transferase family 1 [Allosediminivita pacifica]